MEHYMIFQNLEYFSPAEGVVTGRSSAVIVLLVESIEQTYEIVLLRRKPHLRSYPGDWCFPGGRYERTDSSLWHTALRELQEETRISHDQVDCLGQLSDFYRGNGELVRPFVAVMQKSIFEQSYQLDEDEISELLFLSLDETYHIPTTTPPGKTAIRTPSYCLSIEQHRKMTYLWGLSSSILVHMNNIIFGSSLSVDYGRGFLLTNKCH